VREAPSIAIIGTGFGGIGMGIRLKQAGIDNFTIYGKADEVGGVWWDNTYPGAACDVASSLYSFSFEKNFDWSRTHGTRPEIVAYLRHCVEKYGLRPHLQLSTEIAALEFDEGQGLWRLEAADGRRFAARAVVSACGLFNQPALPDLPGLGDFVGARFHSAQWDHACDLGGKRVAVIGTGCSAAQFVPEIVGQVERLTMFLRTPQYIMPKIEKDFTDAERQTYRRFPVKRAWERLRTYVSFERRFGIQTSAKMNAAAERTALAFLAREIADPDKRLKLTPSYRFGCKRTIQSNSYYKALNRAHVEIVREKIERVLPDGILTADGRHHAFDALIYGTGFRPSDYLSFMRVTGRDGRQLRDAWRDGAQAYLGITVNGFPNFFMLYGPNTNTATSIIFMIENQIGYVLKCIRRLRRARFMDVRADVQARFNDEVQRILRTTAWGSGCQNYFRHAAGRIVTQWPKPSRSYRWLTRKVRGGDFEIAA
jgi:cation diffusion facilitator CzcD-associated flavoprotein CzcO